AVLTNLHQAALMRARHRWLPRAAFRIIKVPRAIRLQIKGELVIVIRDYAVVVEVLVEVRLAVVVSIVETRDLIASQNVDLPVDHLATERLEESGGKAF